MDSKIAGRESNAAGIEAVAKSSASRQAAIRETLDGAQDPALETGAAFFKRLTVEGYYTSKIGIDELNKDGVPDTFACTHESHG